MFGKKETGTLPAEKPDETSDIMWTAIDVINIHTGKGNLKEGLRWPEPYLFVADSSVQQGKIQLNNLAKAVNILATHYGYKLATHITLPPSGQCVCMVKSA